MIQIAITNEQTAVKVDELRLRAALEMVLGTGDRTRGTVSVALVDDRTIHELNRRHLQHDYPTDVLSFLLDDDAESFDAEIVVSGERAAAVAADYGLAPADELLLYVIHGALHLIGHDDCTPDDASRMRDAESLHLASFGILNHVPQAARGRKRVSPAAPKGTRT